MTYNLLRQLSCEVQYKGHKFEPQGPINQPCKRCGTMFKDLRNQAAAEGRVCEKDCWWDAFEVLTGKRHYSRHLELKQDKVFI